MLSFTDNISTILKAVRDVNPKRVLDVGGGMGKYSVLIREDSISSRAERGDMSPTDIIEIDCNEDTEYFINQKHHDGLYNNHYHSSVFDFKTPNDYDLILFIDTVEHWNKEETIEMLKKFDGLKLISTPKQTVMYQEHFYGDSRHHITQWAKEDFEIVSDYSTDNSHIFLIK